jgi:hypothetical protein
MHRQFAILAAVFPVVLTAYSPRGHAIPVQSTGPAPAFNFEYAFTAHLNLGPAEKPIPIPGGMRVIEPILNGTVSGPAINATLGYSLAVPTVVNNGTTQLPVINAAGTTDDGHPLYLYEQGIGSPSAQITRIVSDIPPLAVENLRRTDILLAAGGGGPQIYASPKRIYSRVYPSICRPQVSRRYRLSDQECRIEKMYRGVLRVFDGSATT